MQEKILNTSHELDTKHLDELVMAIRSRYYSSQKQVKILDLATGPNGFNLKLVNSLSAENIDYELVLSDISPIHFRRGYKNLEDGVESVDMLNIVYVLADSRDLRKKLKLVPLWTKGLRKVKDILKDTEYSFLLSGYLDGKRVVGFEDKSFDFVIGIGPYGSINTGPYIDAVFESARVLKTGGYHVVTEMHVEKINFDIERTPDAVERAKNKFIYDVKFSLDSVLLPVGLFSAVYTYHTAERIPEQTLQYGDIVKRAVLVHRKI